MFITQILLKKRKSGRVAGEHRTDSPAGRLLDGQRPFHTCFAMPRNRAVVRVFAWLQIHHGRVAAFGDQFGFADRLAAGVFDRDVVGERLGGGEVDPPFAGFGAGASPAWRWGGAPLPGAPPSASFAWPAPVSAWLSVEVPLWDLASVLLESLEELPQAASASEARTRGKVTASFFMAVPSVADWLDFV